MKVVLMNGLEVGKVYRVVEFVNSIEFKMFVKDYGVGVKARNLFKDEDDFFRKIESDSIDLEDEAAIYNSVDNSESFSVDYKNSTFQVLKHYYNERRALFPMFDLFKFKPGIVLKGSEFNGDYTIFLEVGE